MTAFPLPARRLAAAALLCAAGVAHADITALTSLAAFQSASGGASTDSFADLTINTNLGATTVTRQAGAFDYTLTTQTDFFVVPVASAIALSTGTYSDSISLGSFSSPVRAVGANFYGTNVLGEVTAGALTVVATDINGLVKSQTLTGGSASGFLGFISDVPLASVVVSMSTPNTNVWATLDNVSVSAVPEAGTWLMAMLGGVAVLRFARRRG